MKVNSFFQTLVEKAEIFSLKFWNMLQKV